MEYASRVRIAAHRGNSILFPENTMEAYASALTLPIDQLEVDVQMTRDGHIVMMHDDLVDRTTDGTGRIRDMTLAQVRALDAGSFKDARFRGVRVPTFAQLLELLAQHPAITANVELKDYPITDRAWAYRSADTTLRMIEDAGFVDRVWINCWNVEMLEYVDREYGHRYRLHGYYPFNRMSGERTRDPYDYLHCVALFGTREQPVVDKQAFDEALARGIEPWCHYPKDEIENIDRAIENGCVMLTCNDPARILKHLQARGLHV